MQSMTGFGVGKSQSESYSFEVTIRAVNGRFLETRFHIPRELISLEADFKKVLGEYLKRGTVDIFVVKRQKSHGGSHRVHLNLDLAGEYKKGIDQLAKKLKVKSAATAETLFRLPEVIKFEDIGEFTKADLSAAKKAFVAACKACSIEKKREGLSLRKDLEKLLEQLSEHVDELRGLRKEANELLDERFRQRIKAKLEGQELDSQRLAQEVVFQLDKADINEELTRLDEHIKMYKKTVMSAEAEGKKLDFYTQELLREINTIGSKSQVAKLTQTVVEAKTAIERLREQVQNIE
jgi:uncharacterized protein (TIGR00255 family)